MGFINLLEVFKTLFVFHFSNFFIKFPIFRILLIQFSSVPLTLLVFGSGRVSYGSGREEAVDVASRCGRNQG